MSGMTRLAGILALITATVAPADIVATGTLVHNGQITRATATEITIRVAAGEVSIPRSEIVRVEVPAPPALAAASEAVRARKYSTAVQILKPVVDQLAGLPTVWMADAILTLGDAYAGIPEATNARRTYDLLKQLHPQSARIPLMEVKYTRILVEQRQYAEALPMLEKFVTPLLAKSSIAEAEEVAAAEALLALGDCQRAEGRLESALDSYLTVVTLFDVEPLFTVQAQYRAAEVFEAQKKWKRAKDSYVEVLARRPPEPIATEVQQKLAALTAAHPE